MNILKEFEKDGLKFVLVRGNLKPISAKPICISDIKKIRKHKKALIALLSNKKLNIKDAIETATNISIDTMTQGKLNYAEFRRVTDAVEDINIKEPHRIKETEAFIDWLDSCGIGWFNEFE